MRREPACPYVADALAAAGRVVADAAEPVVDAIVDPRVEAAALIGFALYCWLIAYALPYVQALVRMIP
jgi:hypothetical protein